MRFLDEISDADFVDTLNCVDKLVSVEFHKNDRVTDTALVTLLQSSPVLRTLTVCDCDQLNDSALCSIAKWCVNLQYLHLTAITLTNVGVVPILMLAQDLRCLNLGSNPHLNDEIARYIGLHCTKLTTLTLRGIYSMSDVGVSAIAASCSSLQKLHLPCSTFITDDGVVAVARGCPLLVELNCDIITALTDVSMMAIAQHCPNLQNLQLTACQLITDTGMTALARGCTNLRHLRIPFLYRITDAAVEAVAENCPNLRTLHASSCLRTTKRYMYKLAQCCTQLELLSVERLDQSDETKNGIVDVFTVLAADRGAKVTVTVTDVDSFHGQTNFSFEYS